LIDATQGYGFKAVIAYVAWTQASDIAARLVRGPLSGAWSMHRSKKLPQEGNTMRSLIITLVAVFALTTAAVAAPIHDAAKAGDLAKVRQLLADGADVDARDYDGDTPLHWAARQDHADVIEGLLDAGADGSLKNDDRKTPYDEANKRKLKKIAPSTYWRLRDTQYK